MSDSKPGFLGRLFGGRKPSSGAEAPEVTDAATDAAAPASQPADAPTIVPAPATETPATETPDAETPAKATSDAETSDADTRDADTRDDDTPTADLPGSGLPASDPPGVGPGEGGEPAPARRRSWLARLTDGLARSSASLTGGIAALFTKRRLDAATLEELEELLLQADLGLDTALSITGRIGEGCFDKEISADEVRRILAEEVARVLAPVARPLALKPEHRPQVILFVGVNGTGKTTTIGKLAAKLAAEGKTVMLAAGDTFRAAAVEQLRIWGRRTGAQVIARDTGADAAGLVYDALQAARDRGVDVLLVDTAGRLQNRAELMAELEKVVRVLRKQDPSAPHDVLLTLDATTGQNAMSQVEIFGKTAGVTGLVMTKLDGTARGGILVAIAAKHGLPVHFIGVGEGVEDLEPFRAEDFANAIAGRESGH